MIEFKHSSDLTEPKPPATGKGRRRYIAEAAGWAKNQAKWAAARAFCEERGWIFMVMSEKELGAKYYPGKK